MAKAAVKRIGKAGKKTTNSVERKKETTLNWSIPGLAVLAVKVWAPNQNPSEPGDFVAVKLAMGVPGGEGFVADYGGNTDPVSQPIEKFQEGLLRLSPNERRIKLILINYSTVTEEIKVTITFAFDDPKYAFQHYHFKLKNEGEILTEIPVKTVGV